MRPLLLERAKRRFGAPLLVLAAIHVLGSIGYRIIGGPQYTWIDCLYMSFITIATIGFAEVIDLAGHPGGRIFTMVLGFVGIGTTWYIFSTMTAFIVEGEINVALRRRRMLNRISRLEGHFIVCGVGRVGSNVANELAATGRDYVVIDINQAHIDAFRERYPDTVFLHGDGSEDELLTNAGVMRAAGVFAVVGDDSKNLVISLSAKQLNPNLRVVARCHDVGFIEKIRKVGADAIVSPDFTGGMRIASAMVRPRVVNFLDEMLRSDGHLRVEEITVGTRHAGTTLGAVELKSANHVLLAIRMGTAWHFNPAPDTLLRGGEVIVAMATPEGRRTLEAQFA